MLVVRVLLPVQNQKKHIIFKDALMTMWEGWYFIKRIVIGTFVCLKQTCNSCDHMHEWDSQPFVKNIPAGNILSASILLGGGLPSHDTCMHFL